MQTMNSSKSLLANANPLFISALLICLIVTSSALAQSVQHLSITVPGGMPGRPLITGVNVSSNSVTVTWDGPSGYYQLFQNLSLTQTNWQPVGARTNLSRRQIVPGVSSKALFRVSGPAPHYAGRQNCTECHQPVYDTVSQTPHAQAFAALQQYNQQTNTGCLICHTVGYGVPTG